MQWNPPEIPVKSPWKMVASPRPVAKLGWSLVEESIQVRLKPEAVAVHRALGGYRIE